MVASKIVVANKNVYSERNGGVIMKIQKWIINILLIALFICVPVLKSDAVTMTIGAQANCDTTITSCIAFPTQLTALCVSASCPFRTNPSYTSSTRFWGTFLSGNSQCVTSTDGGVTWPACTTQPFVASTQEYYAEASDGSVIAAGSTAGTCTIRRSTNGTVSWTDVFTQAVACLGNNTEGQTLHCLSNGTCELISSTTADSKFRMFRSTDNGASWTAVTVDTLGTNDLASGSAWNGSAGISAAISSINGLATAFVAIGDVWISSAAWANIGDCWGNVVYNNVGRAICYSAGTGYTVRAGDGTLVSSIVLPGAALGIDIGGPAFSNTTNALYVLATTTTSTLGIWLSRDNLNTFVLIGQSSAAIGGVRGGNMFMTNGCVYFTGGVARFMFGKIC